MVKKHLSEDSKRCILELRKEGKSYREIGERLGVAKATVHLWVTRAASLPDGEIPATIKQPGRSRLTSPNTDRMLKRRVLESPSISARELRAENPECLGNVSIRTIQHRLQKDLSLPSRRPAPKPLLTQKMKAKRLDFAKRYVDWTTEQWSKVMFSDESRFVTFSNRRRSVRRPLGSDRNDPRFTQKTVKHPASVMVWGCFSAKGRGGLRFLEKGVTMNSERYIETLEERLPTHMHIHGCNIFMQDNAPCHRSRRTMGWFDEAEIEVLEWPGNSPDLNPIENLWHVAKMKLQGKNTGSVPKLIRAIQDMWVNDLTPEYCRNLVDSMPRRLRRVIAAKGAMTKY